MHVTETKQNNKKDERSNRYFTIPSVQCIYHKQYIVTQVIKDSYSFSRRKGC